jgi:hypothetical protein
MHRSTLVASQKPSVLTVDSHAAMLLSCRVLVYRLITFGPNVDSWFMHHGCWVRSGWARRTTTDNRYTSSFRLPDSFTGQPIRIPKAKQKSEERSGPGPTFKHFISHRQRLYHVAQTQRDRRGEMMYGTITRLHRKERFEVILNRIFHSAQREGGPVVLPKPI